MPGFVFFYAFNSLFLRICEYSYYRLSAQVLSFQFSVNAVSDRKNYYCN